MSTLVTGGRGFVGRHLVDQLLARGTKVISYNRDYAIDPRDGLTTVQGELFDIPRMLDTLRIHGVERIIHTAGQSHPGVSIEIPWTTFAANAEGTMAVYEAARVAGVRRIVNFSSECALGNVDPGTPVGEDVKPAPSTVYGVTKVAGELFGTVYNSLYGMEIASLRVTEVFGPGLWMPSLLGDMIRAGLHGEKFHLDAGGDHPFQFVFVDDVATAARLAATTDSLNQAVYNVSGGSRVTVDQLAHELVHLLPGSSYDIGPGFLPQWDRIGELDLSASTRDLGYTPQWTLQQGLSAQIDWIRSQTRPS
ncbi:NAD-dependent epimerase/dehydratase family protein [Mycolicibacterium sp. P9-64]|uniref:NAD-dependent epimerase/dehydratase family protein n=1 Tax=Mycolicibacterium sp. P9-64 TaxID=2024612 RepID=UPI0011EFECA7|nr:NAD-dependent epimerase/dehydratase family protein [Mycolicibacterium sp. P9-64]KAA0077274.1 NAD-dependent epimerase/dehydratase family protein [Mycolicibacterium sp. P9-64]